MKKWYVTMQVVMEVEAETVCDAQYVARDVVAAIEPYDTEMIGEEPKWGDPSWSKDEIAVWQATATAEKF